MLETKIEGLILAVERLQGAVEYLTIQLKSGNSAEPKPKAEKAKHGPVDIADTVGSLPTPEKKAVANETPSRDALQSKCLTLVREDRSRKDKISAALAKFDAKLIKDIPDDRLADFATELDAIA